MINIDWDSYASEYDLLCLSNPDYLNLMQEIRALLDKANANNSINSICEFGSGTGNVIAQALKNFIGSKIYSIEYNEQFLNIQRNKISQSNQGLNVEFIRKDIRSLETLGQNKMDLILIVHVLNFFSESDRSRIIQNAYDLLKPEGYLLISDIGRPIPIDKWLEDIVEELKRTRGKSYSKYFLENTQFAREVNYQAIEKQKSGESYMHSLSEFKAFISSFGFQIVTARDDLYRGIDDLILAKKATHPPDSNLSMRSK